MKNEITTATNLIKIIDESRQNALRKVNEELIRMYWQVGEFLSNESKKHHSEMRILTQLQMKYKMLSLE